MLVIIFFKQLLVIYTAKVRGNEKNNKFIIKGGKNDIDGNQGNNNTIEIIYKQPSDVYLVENKI